MRSMCVCRGFHPLWAGLSFQSRVWAEFDDADIEFPSPLGGSQFSKTSRGALRSSDPGLWFPSPLGGSQFSKVRREASSQG